VELVASDCTPCTDAAYITANTAADAAASAAGQQRRLANRSITRHDYDGQRCAVRDSFVC